MTTVRRVMALTAVTVALAAAVGISGDRGGGPGRPLLVPGLRFDDVVGLELQVGDRPPVIIALDEGNPRITAPVAAAADENAVRDLISAVAAARLDRTARAAPGLEHPAAILRLRRRAGATTEVQVGATALASGQTWLAIDQRAGLVPSWVAEAIVRDPDSLRRRRPFPAATAITAVELHGPGLDLVLAGSPVRRLDAGVKVPLDPARRDHFLERLAALAVVLPVAVDGPAAPAITIRVPTCGSAVRPC